MSGKQSITLNINGRGHEIEVEPRRTLVDAIRDNCGQTGTHIGCEHGICGACTVEIDGEIARSCITYAVACDGARVRTIEGFDDDTAMARLRQAFTEAHALQCGYCTPGMMLAAIDLLAEHPDPTEDEIRHGLEGNLCRCTGYQNIVRAVRNAAAAMGPGVPS